MKEKIYIRAKAYCMQSGCNGVMQRYQDDVTFDWHSQCSDCKRERPLASTVPCSNCEDMLIEDGRYYWCDTCEKEFDAIDIL